MHPTSTSHSSPSLPTLACRLWSHLSVCVCGIVNAGMLSRCTSLLPSAATTYRTATARRSAASSSILRRSGLAPPLDAVRLPQMGAVLHPGVLHVCAGFTNVAIDLTPLLHPHKLPALCRCHSAKRTAHRTDLAILRRRSAATTSEAFCDITASSTNHDVYLPPQHLWAGLCIEKKLVCMHGFQYTQGSTSPSSGRRLASAIQLSTFLPAKQWHGLAGHMYTLRPASRSSPCCQVWTEGINGELRWSCVPVHLAAFRSNAYSSIRHQGCRAVHSVAAGSWGACCSAAAPLKSWGP